MTILWLLVPAAVLLGGVFVAGFLLCVRHGQFDDLETPALRILEEDTVERKKR